MKNIIIAGAGGFGREAYYLIKAINKAAPKWHFKGYINDIPVDLHKFKIDAEVLGTIRDWQPSDDEVFAIGISSPKGKEKVVEILKSKGAHFASLIHPLAQINETAELGEGCMVSGGSSIGDCSRIGNFVSIAGSMIGQDVVIGDFSTTTGFSNVPTAKLGKRVFVGSQAVVLNDVGDDAYICAGSVVLKKVKNGEHVFGVPAKRLNF